MEMLAGSPAPPFFLLGAVLVLAIVDRFMIGSRPTAYPRP